MEDFDKIAPKLSGMKKENPFKAPDNYFDDFPTKMQEKINETAVEKRGFLAILKPQLALIFGMLGFALVAVVVLQMVDMSPEPGQSEKTAIGWEPVDNVEITREYIAEFDEELIIDYYIEESNNNWSEEEEELLTEEEMMDYLADNVDMYEIIDSYE